MSHEEQLTDGRSGRTDRRRASRTDRRNRKGVVTVVHRNDPLSPSARFVSGRPTPQNHGEDAMFQKVHQYEHDTARW